MAFVSSGGSMERNKKEIVLTGGLKSVSKWNPILDELFRYLFDIGFSVTAYESTHSYVEGIVTIDDLKRVLRASAKVSKEDVKKDISSRKAQKEFELLSLEDIQRKVEAIYLYGAVRGAILDEQQAKESKEKKAETRKPRVQRPKIAFEEQVNEVMGFFRKYRLSASHVVKEKKSFSLEAFSSEIGKRYRNFSEEKQDEMRKDVVELLPKLTDLKRIRFPFALFGITDLDFLRDMPQLESIKMFAEYYAYDLSPLLELPSLTTLHLDARMYRVNEEYRRQVLRIRKEHPNRLDIELIGVEREEGEEDFYKSVETGGNIRGNRIPDEYLRDDDVAEPAQAGESQEAVLQRQQRSIQRLEARYGEYFYKTIEDNKITTFGIRQDKARALRDKLKSDGSKYDFYIDIEMVVGRLRDLESVTLLGISEVNFLLRLTKLREVTSIYQFDEKPLFNYLLQNAEDLILKHPNEGVQVSFRDVDGNMYDSPNFDRPFDASKITDRAKDRVFEEEVKQVSEFLKDMGIDPNVPFEDGSASLSSNVEERTMRLNLQNLDLIDLSPLESLRGLEFVDLKGTSITREQIFELFQVHPKPESLTVVDNDGEEIQEINWKEFQEAEDQSAQPGLSFEEQKAEVRAFLEIRGMDPENSAVVEFGDNQDPNSEKISLYFSPEYKVEYDDAGRYRKREMRQELLELLGKLKNLYALSLPFTMDDLEFVRDLKNLDYLSPYVDDPMNYSFSPLLDVPNLRVFNIKRVAEGFSSLQEFYKLLRDHPNSTRYEVHHSAENLFVAFYDPDDSEYDRKIWYEDIPSEFQTRPQAQPTQPALSFDEQVAVAKEFLSDNGISEEKLEVRGEEIELSLAGQAGLSDISALSKLTNLRKLDLDYTEVSDISALKGLTNLTSLRLYRTHISDISVLRGLKNLKRLSLGRTSVNNISDLSGLTSLTNLSLTDTQVSDISALRGLTNLEVLSLSKTQVSDISALNGLMKLREVSFGNVQVNNKQIYELFVANENRENLLVVLFGEGVLDEENIRWDDVPEEYHRRVEEASQPALSFEEQVTAVREFLRQKGINPDEEVEGDIRLEVDEEKGTIGLNLRSRGIGDLTSLASLTHITHLYLQNSDVSSLDFVSRMTGLVALNIQGTDVEDLTPVRNLKNLSYLSVSPKCSDLTIVKNLRRLKLLFINDSAVTDLSAVEDLRLLEYIDATNTAITDDQIYEFFRRSFSSRDDLTVANRLGRTIDWEAAKRALMRPGFKDQVTAARAFYEKYELSMENFNDDPAELHISFKTDASERYASASSEDQEAMREDLYDLLSRLDDLNGVVLPFALPDLDCLRGKARLKVVNIVNARLTYNLSPLLELPFFDELAVDKFHYDGDTEYRRRIWRLRKEHANKITVILASVQRDVMTGVAEEVLEVDDLEVEDIPEEYHRADDVGRAALTHDEQVAAVREFYDKYGFDKELFVDIEGQMHIAFGEDIAVILERATVEENSLIKREFEELLTKLKGLRGVVLPYHVDSLDCLRDKPFLQVIDFTDAHRVLDFSPLQDLPALRLLMFDQDLFDGPGERASRIFELRQNHINPLNIRLKKVQRDAGGWLRQELGIHDITVDEIPEEYRRADDVVEGEPAVESGEKSFERQMQSIDQLRVNYGEYFIATTRDSKIKDFGIREDSLTQLVSTVLRDEESANEFIRDVKEVISGLTDLEEVMLHAGLLKDPGFLLGLKNLKKVTVPLSPRDINKPSHENERMMAINLILRHRNEESLTVVYRNTAEGTTFEEFDMDSITQADRDYLFNVQVGEARNWMEEKGIDPDEVYEDEEQGQRAGPRVDASSFPDERRFGLFFEGTSVSDVSSLGTMSYLSNLYLQGTSVGDIGFVAALKNLENLNIEGTDVDDLTPISSLENLRGLNVAPRCSDLAPVKDLKKLQYLTLDNSSVTDLSVLEGLPGLREVSARNTAITDEQIYALFRALPPDTRDNLTVYSSSDRQIKWKTVQEAGEGQADLTPRDQARLIHDFLTRNGDELASHNVHEDGSIDLYLTLNRFLTQKYEEADVREEERLSEELRDLLLKLKNLKKLSLAFLPTPDINDYYLEHISKGLEYLDVSLVLFDPVLSFSTLLKMPNLKTLILNYDANKDPAQINRLREFIESHPNGKALIITLQGIGADGNWETKETLRHPDVEEGVETEVSFDDQVKIISEMVESSGIVEPTNIRIGYDFENQTIDVNLSNQDGNLVLTQGVIDALSKVSYLRKLKINGVVDPNLDFRPLGKLKRLEELDFQATMVNDISFLLEIHGLKKVILEAQDGVTTQTPSHRSPPTDMFWEVIYRHPNVDFFSILSHSANLVVYEFHKGDIPPELRERFEREEKEREAAANAGPVILNANEQFVKKLVGSLVDRKGVLKEVGQRLKEDGLEEEFKGMLKKMDIRDAAMLSNPIEQRVQITGGQEKKEVGGIDLNPDILKMDVRQDEGAPEIEIETPLIENIEINGLIPVIINIIPATDLPLILGEVNKEKGVGQLSKR